MADGLIESQLGVVRLVLLVVMATFKHHASATDLRDCQSAVLWEWASSTGLSLPECAAKFARDYRSFWPLAQLGDPMVKEDRMFSVDQRDVLSILRKQEAQFGTYVTGSMTEEPANAFQRILQGHRIGHSPVWVHNTHAPRAHVEALLRKYGVPYLPSSAPGCRMIDFFRKRSLIAKPAEASPTARTYSPAVRTRAGLIYTAPEARPVGLPLPNAAEEAWHPAGSTLPSVPPAYRSVSSSKPGIPPSPTYAEPGIPRGRHTTSWHSLAETRSLSSRSLHVPEKARPVTANSFALPMSEPRLGSPLRAFASPNLSSSSAVNLFDITAGKGMGLGMHESFPGRFASPSSPHTSPARSRSPSSLTTSARHEGRRLRF